MGGAPHVLVVDDDELVARGFGRLLRRGGMVAEVAGSGGAAMEMIRARPFDALVLDLAMPGMSGMELLRQVRSFDTELPVVLVTGAPGLESAVDAVRYGALRYLLKPVDSETMLHTVHEAVGRHRRARLERLAVAGHEQRLAALGDPMELGATFEEALAGLWMAYQPIVRSDSGTLFGHEALLRSKSPRMSSPATILTAAELLGRVEDLGRRVRASVASFMSRSAVGTVFVNLHPRDLLDDDLYEQGAPLSAHAPRVVLEVTERASLHEVADLAERVARLRRLGYRIAVDDLGEGYAGLTSFASLSPEIVKLDMSLVRDLDHSPIRQKLVSSMVSLCRELDTLVVAEGIETDGERRTVTSLGCDLLQGYLLGRPAPAPEPALA